MDIDTYVFVHVAEDHGLEFVQGCVDTGPAFALSDVLVELEEQGDDRLVKGRFVDSEYTKQAAVNMTRMCEVHTVDCAASLLCLHFSCNVICTSLF